MPSRPKRPCKHIRCPGLTNDKSGYCEEHREVAIQDRKQRNREYKAKRTDTAEQKFYSSSVWKKVRAIQLSREPICEECLKDDRYIPATVADHITPIKEGGEKLSLDNLRSLCFSCHSRRTRLHESGKA